VKFDIENF